MQRRSVVDIERVQQIQKCSEILVESVRIRSGLWGDY